MFINVSRTSSWLFNNYYSKIYFSDSNEHSGSRNFGEKNPKDKEKLANFLFIVHH